MDADRHQIHAGTSPSRSDASTWVTLDGEVVVFDERTSTAVVLNRSASALWEAIDGSATIGAIAAGIAEVASMPVAQLEGQIVDAVRDMVDRGLVSVD